MFNWFKKKQAKLDPIDFSDIKVSSDQLIIEKTAAKKADNKAKRIAHIYS